MGVGANEKEFPRRLGDRGDSGRASLAGPGDGRASLAGPGFVAKSDSGRASLAGPGFVAKSDSGRAYLFQKGL